MSLEMKSDSPRDGITVDLFSAVPRSADATRGPYIEKLTSVARWSEEAGCRGILVFTDNSVVDPWLAAQVILQSTSRLCPLVAIQPVYTHPYTVAKLVSTLAFFYDRRVYLNMVAGGFRTDLQSLCDETPHDLRYERLLEYTTIIQELLRGKTVTYEGKFYNVKNLSLKPALPAHLFPGVFLSGSSEAGVLTAKTLGATAIEYPKPTAEYTAAPQRTDSGLRVGIVSAESSGRAWDIAHNRFPGDRKGQLAHKLATKYSDSQWHKQMSELEDQATGATGRYWLWPFKNYNTFCPYLVGDYEEVSDELSKYITAGFTNFVLDIPAEEEDLRTTGIVFRMAVEKAGALQSARAA